MLSRQGQVLKNEWRLSEETFRWICSRSPFGTPTVDLFANKFNHQLSRYMSPCPDLDAVAVDALSAGWPAENLFAFPPAGLMDRVVIKLHQERPQALLLVAPLSTAAPWYPTVRSHARWVQPIPATHLRLLQPHWDHVHPAPELLCLGVWCITWKDWRREATPTL